MRDIVPYLALPYQAMISTMATGRNPYLSHSSADQWLFAWNFTGEYDFGFNGKESDSEGMGDGLSTYDYGFRIYNPSLGKFLSVDPLHSKYPMFSVYHYASNTPVWAIDLDGAEALVVQGGGRATVLLFTVAMNISLAFTSTGVSLYITPEVGVGAGLSIGAGVSVGYFPYVNDSEAFKGAGVNLGGSVCGNGLDAAASICDSGLSNGGGSGAVPKVGGGAGAETHISFGYSFLIGTLTYENAKQQLTDMSIELGLAPEEVLFIYDEGLKKMEETIGPISWTTMTQESNGLSDAQNRDSSKDSPNLQRCGDVLFDSNQARPGKGNMIVRDLRSGKDFGINRNDDGSYRFDCGSQDDSK
jgi:RHS repeat-associated protein